MLVLTRKENEQVVIVKDGVLIATVAIVRLGNGKVHLGIGADRSVVVHRQEVWDAIEQEIDNDRGGEEAKRQEQEVDRSE